MLQLKLQFPDDLPVILFFMLPHFLVHLPLSIIILHIFLQLYELLADSLKLFLNNLKVFDFLESVLQRIVQLSIVL